MRPWVSAELREVEDSCKGLGEKLHFQSKELIHKNGLCWSKALHRSVVLWSWYFKYVHLHVNESLQDNLIMQ